MKYIFLNDICSFFKKCSKYLMLYLLILLIFISIKYISKCEFNIRLLLITIGFINPKDYSVLDIAVFVLNCSFNFFIIFQLFDNDIKNGFCNIFLRFKKIKWILLKIISCAIFIFIKSFLIVLFLILFFKVNYLSLLIYFIIGILYTMFINIFVIIFMTYNTKIKSILMILYSLLIFLNIIPFNVITLVNHWIFILVGIIIQIIFLYYRKKKIYIMLEEGDLK